MMGQKLGSKLLFIYSPNSAGFYIFTYIHTYIHIWNL